MLFRSFKNNTGRGRVWELGRLSEERIEQIDGIKLAEPVDTEMPVNAVGVLSVLICVDTSTEDELYQLAVVQQLIELHGHRYVQGPVVSPSWQDP